MIIERNLICSHLSLNKKEDIIGYLSQKAYEKGKLNNIEEYQKAVFHREEEFSTALGYLVAIPHGQSDAVNEPFIAFGRCENEMQWDKEQVKLIFMIGVPLKNREKTHMKILANISRKLIDETFRKSLLEAKDGDEIYHILSEITIEEE